MKPERKYRLETASNNYWEGGGVSVLRRVNLHPHLPPRFTQLSWLFGSHGGFLAHQTFTLIFHNLVVRLAWMSSFTDNNLNQCKVCDEARMRARQLRRVKTPGDPLGVSNTTEMKTTSWTPNGPRNRQESFPKQQNR